MLNTKSGTLTLGEKTMDYVSFGNGNKTLVMLPGLGDGIKTVKNTALPFAYMYRAFSEEFKVYVFSRINELPLGYTTRDMARDTMLAMDKLDISRACFMGVSQGGMIASYILLDYPHLAEKTVLAVTLSRPNAVLNAVIANWIKLAEKNDYRQLLTDTAERSYSETYLKKHRRLFPLYGLLNKPADFSRFIVQANSCLTHDCYERLGEITAPILIIGGAKDKIAGCNASVEMAEKIKNSTLFVYEDFGHAVYEEAQDFNERVLEYFLCDAK